MAQKSRKGTVRIIAGEWRGRRLPVVDLPGLRPSGDRLRETLFNWLQLFLPGAACADLFAGTGALGLEAASRGAASVVLVERQVRAAAQLQENIDLLKAEQVRLFRGDALSWLRSQGSETLDIIFVDPPFEQDAGAKVLDGIHESGCLRPGGLVYLESPANSLTALLPPGWQTWREKTMGDVRMQVFKSATSID
jgi:16S rRNA (guanine966-N2)-methyltransferase